MNPFALIGPADFYGRIAVEAVGRGAILALGAYLLCALLRGRVAWLRRPVLVAALLAQPVLWLLPVSWPGLRWRVFPPPDSLPVTVPMVPLAEAAGTASGGGVSPGGPAWSLGNEALMGMIGAAWLAVAAVLLVRTACQYLTVRHALGSGRAAGARCREALHQMAARAGAHRAVTILVRADVTIPMAFGVRRPTIVLPERADEWTAEQARAVIGHELAHVVNGDLPTRLLVRLVCAIAWCNPMVHLLARALRSEQEAAADAWVVAHGITGPQYVEGVVTAIRPLVGRAPAAALPLARRASAFRQRMERVLREPVRPREAHGVAWGAVALAPLLGLGTFALAQAGWHPVAAPGTGCFPLAASALHDRTRRIADGRSEWTVTWGGESCRVAWRSVGQVRLDLIAGRVGLASVRDSVVLRVEGAEPRTLVAWRDADTVWYAVDGEVRATPPDWLGGHLVELDRHTGFAAAARIPHLMRVGGLDAVLAHAREASGRRAGLAYLHALVTLGDLRERQLPAVLDAAVALGAVDDALAHLLDATATRFRLDRVEAQQAFAGAILVLGGTTERGRLARKLMQRRTVDPTIHARLLPEIT